MTKKHKMHNTGWQRFQQAARQGKVTNAHMFVALSGGCERPSACPWRVGGGIGRGSVGGTSRDFYPCG